MKKYRRFCALLFLVLLTALAIITQVAMQKFLSPPRRALQDYHLEILQRPEAHGFSLQHHNAPNGTPYFLCQPRQPGVKGQLLRQQLAARHLSPVPGTLLILHGYRGRKEDMLPVAERFCAAGFTCIIPDLPGHGDHPCNIATFGSREVVLLYDLLDHCSHSHGLPEKTSILGLSQGGAIALQLAAAHPERFEALASLSAFANLGEIMENSTRRQGPLLACLAGPLLPLVNCNARLQHRFSPSSISPENAASQIICPTLIVHGSCDTFIPPDHAKRIFHQLPPGKKRLRLVTDGTHGNLFLLGHEIYADLAAFFIDHSNRHTALLTNHS